MTTSRESARGTGDCLEGLASGPALEARYGVRGEELPQDHPGWRVEAYYLAAMVVNVMLVMAPQKVILGGGVMQQAHLFPVIREVLRTQFKDHINHLGISHLENYVVPPLLGRRAGVLGAVALAKGHGHTPQLF